MPEASQCLESLRLVLMRQREELKEKLANGNPEKEGSRDEHIGRCKQLKDTIDKVSAQIKSLNGGIDDEAEPTK